MKMPKAIVDHPGVAECAPAHGCLSFWEGGPRYDVILKDGWVFTGGRFAGEERRTGLFRSAHDFRLARPERRP